MRLETRLAMPLRRFATGDWDDRRRAVVNRGGANVGPKGIRCWLIGDFMPCHVPARSESLIATG